MSRKSQTMSGLARESDAEFSQRRTLPLPVQNGVQARNNADNIVPSRESQLSHRRAGENRISGQSEKKPSIILARWRCPPEIILNPYWRVAAGEESEEVRVQEQREARLNQFRYLHPSAIPPSPPVSPLEEGELTDDDENTPVIPLEPVDEETPFSTNGVPSSYADVGAAASAAFTALMRTYEQGNLIDTDLLIKLLNEPKMIELLKNIRPLPNSESTQPPVNTLPRVTINPVQENLIDVDLLVKLMSDPKMIEALDDTRLAADPGPTQPYAYPPTYHSMPRESFPPPSTTIFATPLLTYPPMPIPTPTYPASLPPPPVKDVSYLQSLIRQHGVEGPRSILKTSSSSSSPSCPPSVGQGKKKKAYTKPCLFFGTLRGCRQGLGCPFRHESPQQQLYSGGVSGGSGSKRVKLTKDPGNGYQAMR